MKIEELRSLWIENTNKSYGYCRIFKHIKTNQVLLLDDLSNDWLNYEINWFSKDLFDSLK
jgi:hypothetical protein